MARAWMRFSQHAVCAARLAFVLRLAFLPVALATVPGYTTLYRVAGQAVAGRSFLANYQSLFASFLPAASEVKAAGFAGVQFQLREASSDEIYNLVSTGATDFILADSVTLACLARTHRLTYLGTQSVAIAGVSTDAVATAIVASSSRTDITNLTSVVSKRIASASFRTLPDFFAAQKALQDAGVNVFEDPDQLIFSNAESVQDVLADLATGSADVAFLPAGTLETGVAAGTILPTAFKVLNSQPLRGAYGVTASTASYPGWGLVALWSVNPALVAAMASALYRAPAGPAFTGWNTVGAYSIVAQTLSSIQWMDGTGACNTATQVYYSVTCRASAYKLATGSFGSSCAAETLQCFRGRSCLCKPCQELPTQIVDVFAIGSAALNPSTPCGRMTACASLQQFGSLSFRLLLRTSDLMAATCVVTDSWFAYKFRSSDDLSAGSWVAVPNSCAEETYFTVQAPRTGEHLLEISFQGVEMYSSPFIITVTPVTCPSAVQLATVDGTCECDYTVSYQGLDGSCVPFMKGPFWGGLSGGLVLLAGAGVVVLLLIRSRRDRSWIIPLSALEFGDPVESLGRGAYGRVVRAVYRGTPVAVKCVLTRKRSRQRARPGRPLAVDPLAVFDLEGDSSDAYVGDKWRDVFGNSTASSAVDSIDSESRAGGSRRVLSWWPFVSLGRTLGLLSRGSSGGGSHHKVPTRPSQRAVTPTQRTPTSHLSDDLNGWDDTATPSATTGGSGVLYNSVDSPRAEAVDEGTSTAAVVPPYGASGSSRPIRKLGAGDGSSSSLATWARSRVGPNLVTKTTASESGWSEGDGGGWAPSAARIRADFVEEMRRLIHRRHPNIVTMMGACLETSSPLVVMELLERGSLEQLLRNVSLAIDGDMLVPILKDVCAGMCYLHLADPPVLHTDLRASNIMLDAGFKAKVADFGLSHKRRLDGLPGSPLYMAPELLIGGKPTTASDVYAFGLLIYELFTRKEPYEGEDPEEVLLAVASPDLLTPRRPVVPPGTPRDIHNLMSACWHPSAPQRPSFVEIAARLDRMDSTAITAGLLAAVEDRLKEKRLVHQVFPSHIAQALKEGREVQPEEYESVTIFFSDIVGFTNISGQLEPAQVMQLLNRLYNRFDALTEKHGLFKVETIGDAYMAVGGLPDPKLNDAARIAAFAIEAVEAANSVQVLEDSDSMGVVHVRVGFHSGPVVASVVGKINPRYCLLGETVGMASKMEQTSAQDCIHMSREAAALVRAQAPHLQQVSRGENDNKGTRVETFWLVRPGVGVQGLPLPPIAIRRSRDMEDSLMMSPGGPRHPNDSLSRPSLGLKLRRDSNTSTSGGRRDSQPLAPMSPANSSPGSATSSYGAQMLGRGMRRGSAFSPSDLPTVEEPGDVEMTSATRAA